MSVSDLIRDASFEAHMAAAEAIKGGEVPMEGSELLNVTQALSHAYGEAFALLAVSGADQAQLTKMGTIYNDAFNAMVSRIHQNDCAGRA